MSTLLAPLPELVLVEDTESDEVMTLRGIKQSKVPCRVVVQRDGVQALEHLLNTDNQLPALVLLDYHLPRMDGLAVVTSLRTAHRTRFVPVVMFASDCDPAKHDNCIKQGANSYVVKPLDAIEYVDCIIWLTHYWIGLNLVVGHYGASRPEPALGGE